VLDIGCGPGITVALAAERAVAGLVAGVDHSAVMLRQAGRRNHGAIMAGRVDLRLGTAQRLPYPDAHFTKACALHTIHFWSSVETGLRELHRVLASGGAIVLALRMHRPEAGRFDPSRYGFTAAQIAAMTATLDAVGFRDIATQRREFGRETITAVVARRGTQPQSATLPK
jgi:ubiquinone/menaquinone biosynthesis C-methylase UbiE